MFELVHDQRVLVVVVVLVEVEEMVATHREWWDSLVSRLLDVERADEEAAPCRVTKVLLSIWAEVPWVCVTWEP